MLIYKQSKITRNIQTFMAIYLDCNATSPIKSEVSTLTKFYLDEEYGNSGSRTHDFGARAKSAVEKARGQIAEVVSAAKDEVVFTSGATESNNLSILGVECALRQAGKTHIITTSIEHKSVLEPCMEMGRRGFEVSFVKPDPDGQISAEKVVSAITEKTGLITCMLVNNETGCLYPVKEIADHLKDNELDILLHTDAAQAFGKVIEPLQNKRIDLISVSAHKVYGPKGVGALIRRRRNYKKPKLSPLMFGGGQEKGIRPGTLPVALIAGFGLAAELAQKNNLSWWEECEKKKQKCLSAIKDLSPQIHGVNTLPNVINFSVPGINSEAAIVALKDLVAFSNGSACTSSSYTASHVLEAMNKSKETIDGAMRMSWSPDTPDVPWREVTEILKGLLS